jgi:hypothetical protein
MVPASGTILCAGYALQDAWTSMDILRAPEEKCFTHCPYSPDVHVTEDNIHCRVYVNMQDGALESLKQVQLGQAD